VLQRRRKPIFGRRNRAMHSLSFAWAMPGVVLACAIGASIVVVL
jgi:hypothetical protein